MVPGDDPVIKTKHHVGNTEVVEAGAGEPFQYRAPVIADVAGDPALKGRHSRNRVDGFWREERSSDAEGVSRNYCPNACRTPPHFRDLAFAADYASGVGSEEGVVCVGVLWSRAVQKQQVREIEKTTADLTGIFRIPQRLNDWCDGAQSSLLRSSTDAFAEPVARLPAD